MEIVRKKMCEIEEFQILDAVDKVIFMRLMDMAVQIYSDSCSEMTLEQLTKDKVH